MKALIFDLDDTLYDQVQPFRQALKEHMAVKEKLVVPLYLAFREYADQVFEPSVRGEISLEVAHLYRMQMALKDFGIVVTDDEAVSIQASYEKHQKKLDLFPIYEEVFEQCLQKGLELGIITNGPSLHQWDKVRALGVTRWIAESHIVISGQVGSTKPSPEIFHKMEDILQLSGREICYIGDSFPNDVIGAKSCQWSSVWLNHRRRAIPESTIRPDVYLERVEDLPQALWTLLEKE